MKSTMQAKPNKRPDRLDYREPAVNFPRKYFWARKTHWFILTETPPGEEPIPHAFQRRKSPWKPDCPPSSARAPRRTPRVSRERRKVTPARRGASHRGWGRKWGSGGNQALGAYPGAPQFWGFWLPRFDTPGWLPCSVLLPDTILFLEKSISKRSRQEAFGAFLASRNIKALPSHHSSQGKCYFRNSSGKKTSSS